MDPRTLGYTWFCRGRTGSRDHKTKRIPSTQLPHQHTSASGQRSSGWPPCPSAYSSHTAAFGIVVVCEIREKWQNLLSVLRTMTKPNTLNSTTSVVLKQKRKQKKREKQNISKPGGEAPRNPHPLSPTVKWSIIPHFRKAVFSFQEKSKLCVFSKWFFLLSTIKKKLFQNTFPFLLDFSQVKF